MDIIVLLKQVPATEAAVSIAGDGKRIDIANVKWVVNPYDEFAVEEALRIRDKQGGSVTILSAGGEKPAEAIRTALAMGADKGVLIQDPALAGCDGLGIAKVLAAAVKTLPCDLIIAGMRAVDDDNYLVGPAVAELMGVPHVSMVVHEEIADGVLKCKRTIDGGTAVCEVRLPALMTTQRGLNEPRYASLPGIMKAKKKPIDTRTVADLGLDAASLAPVVEILEMTPPPEREAGRMIEGDSATAKAAALVDALRNEAKAI